MTTAILILAAGSSVRMGAPKQLLDFVGQPLVRHAARIALEAECGPVVVVLGAHENAIRPALADLPVELVVNPRWPDGMGTSIHVGLESAAARFSDGVILLLADQPRVSSEFLGELVRCHGESGKPIIAARYAQTVGVPAFFARAAFPLLKALAPDQGCKKIIQTHPDDAVLLDCPQAAVDLDTPEDYTRAIAGAPTAP